MVNSEKHESKDTFDLREFLQSIKKNFGILILSMLAMGCVGYFGSKYLITAEYESAITMIVNTRQNNTTAVTNDSITSAQNLVSTYSVIIKSNTVLNQVIDSLDLDMTYDDLNSNVYVNAVDDTQIMRVAVRNPDKDTAAKIVQKISAIAPGVIVETVEAGSCKVISQVMTSDNPVTPNVAKNTLLMAAVGLMANIIGIALRALFKEKRLVDDNDVQKYFEVPILGVIPEVEGEHK